MTGFLYPLRYKYRVRKPSKLMKSPGSNSGGGKKFKGPINWRKGSGMKDSK